VEDARIILKWAPLTLAMSAMERHTAKTGSDIEMRFADVGMCSSGTRQPLL